MNDHDHANNAQLMEQERHFNHIQHQYRFLSSTVTTALLGALGYVVLNNAADNQHQLEIILTLLPILATLSVGATSFLDLAVYHVLLDACFRAGKEIEENNPSFPKMRLNMLDGLSSNLLGRGAKGYVAIFYAVQVFIIYFGSIFAQFVLLTEHSWVIIILQLIFFLLSLGFLLFISRKDTLKENTHSDAGE